MGEGRTAGKSHPLKDRREENSDWGGKGIPELGEGGLGQVHKHFKPSSTTLAKDG